MGAPVPRLILICGLPGSGKTTLAKRLADERQALRLSEDEWMAQLGIDLWNEQARDRLEKQFWWLAQDLLRLGDGVILESGFWLRSDRDEKRLGARTLGAAVELHYLPTPMDELVRRLVFRQPQRGHETSPISRSDLESWSRSFEAPDDDEMALFDRPINAFESSTESAIVGQDATSPEPSIEVGRRRA